MSLSSGRRGGSSVVANKRARKSKKLCELGISCPYQHEYQHQLEFTHERSATKTSTETVREGGARRRGAASNGRSLNGTGTRGRKLAVAADRRRAERSLRQGVGQDLLSIHSGDSREAQRSRWVMRMQEEMKGKEPVDSARAGPRPRVRSRGGPSLSSNGVQLLPPPSPSSAPSPSGHTSPSSSFGHHHVATGRASSEAAPPETGQRSNGMEERKRASSGGTSNEGGVEGRGREVICVDCDTDDD